MATWIVSSYTDIDVELRPVYPTQNNENTIKEYQFSGSPFKYWLKKLISSS